MAKLTSKKRKRLRKSAFALPKKRKYPIFDRSHGANALARAAQQLHAGKLSSKAYKKIVREVCERYPDFPSCKERNPRATTTLGTAFALWLVWALYNKGKEDKEIALLEQNTPEIPVSLGYYRI